MSAHAVTTGLATKVVLQQHSRLLRDMLVHWLGTLPGYVVVGVTDAKPELLRLCRRSRPDVVVLDVGPEGLVGFARLCSTDQDAAQDSLRMPYLIGLYGRLDVVAVPQLRRAGVQRLVSMQSGLGGLYAALQAARTLRRPVTSAAATADLLTARELEVLTLICGGWSTTRIATALAISPHTVINHTRRIFAKLNVRSRTQAAAEAVARGLFREPLSISARPAVLPAAVAGPVTTAVATVAGPVAGVAGGAVAGMVTGAVPPPRRARAELVGSPPVTLVDPTADEWSAARTKDGDVVVVLSDPSSGAGVAEAVARGAGAVLGADSLAEHLPPALAMLRAGYLVAPARPVRALITTAHPGVAPSALTRRERDILNSVAQGDSVRQTAQALGIAVKTVQNEQRQLFCRLGVRNRTEALMLARSLGLVDPHYGQPAQEPLPGPVPLRLEGAPD